MYKIKGKGLILFSIIIISCIGFLLFKGTSALSEVPANPAFDDINFYKCVVDEYNKKNKTNLPYTVNLTDAQLGTIVSLYCWDMDIISANGLDKLVNLKYLSLIMNELTSLDVSKNVSLTMLDMRDNQLSSLDLSKNLVLEQLDVSYNQLSSLDLSNNPALQYTLDVSNNQLTSLDVSNNLAVTRLDAYNNQLTSLDVNGVLALKELFVYNNQLSSLDVSGVPSLTKLSVYNNQLTSLDVSSLLALTELYASSNKLSSLNVNGSVSLKKLSVFNNQLSSLDVSGARSLNSLNVENNQLTSLDVSSVSTLTDLSVYNNQLTNLNVSGALALKGLSAYNNQLSVLDISGAPSLKTLDVNSNKLSSFDVNGASSLEILQIHNNKLTSLNVSGASSLMKLMVYNNQLTSLDVSGVSTLTELYAHNNQLTNIELNGAISLEKLWADSNKLVNIDVSKNLNLLHLRLTYNQLKSLDVSKNNKLKKLEIGYVKSSGSSGSTGGYTPGSNFITYLDVSNNLQLEDLYVSYNQLASLDVSKNTALKNLNIDGNPYKEEIYIYKGEQFEIGNNVKIPSQIKWSKLNWRSDNSNIASVNSDGLVDAIGAGSVKIIGDGIYYDNTSIINVIGITSDKYLINDEENYVYIVGDKDVNVIKNNIKVSNNNVSIDINDNKLYVKYGSEILKIFNLISIFSNTYDLNNDYIYVDGLNIDLSKISKINCDVIIDNNKLLVKQDDVVVKTYQLVDYSSEVYDLSKKYIYVGSGELNLNNISTIGCDKKIKDDKLLISYNDSILKQYDIVSVSSNKYDLSKKNIYVGFGFQSDIVVKYGSSIVSDNKLYIKYNDIVLDEYNFVEIKLDSYSISDNNIIISKDVTYDEFIQKIEVDNGITYKIFCFDDEVTTGDIFGGMVLKIYYEGKLMDEYLITNKAEDEYYKFDNSLVIDEVNKVISNIDIGILVDDIIKKVDTNGTVNVLDKNNNVKTSGVLKTGDKIKIELFSQVLIYKVSISCDVNGDGNVNINDVIQLSKYIINNNSIKGHEYIKAGDINNNGKIDINDIIKIGKVIVSGN